MGFIMLKSSQAQITQLKINLIVISVAYKSYVKSSEFSFYVMNNLFQCFWIFKTYKYF